jgi:GNAT superfamily N-acetyltransferase
VLRAACADDEARVVEIAQRLAEFPPPRGRTREEVIEGDVRALHEFFRRPPPGSELLVAERGAHVLGLSYLEAPCDYFTGIRHGHLSVLAVAAEAEGQGIGRLLLDGSAAWARERGYPKLTLNVFVANAHARTVYEKVGFEAEAVKYTLPL